GHQHRPDRGTVEGAERPHGMAGRSRVDSDLSQRAAGADVAGEDVVVVGEVHRVAADGALLQKRQPALREGHRQWLSRPGPLDMSAYVATRMKPVVKVEGGRSPVQL